MKVKERRALWRERIAVQEASGQSVPEWCEAHQIQRRPFYDWKKRLQKAAESPAATWIPVKREESQAEAEPHLFVQVGVAAIQVKPGFSATLLADVVRTLHTLC